MPLTEDANRGPAKSPAPAPPSGRATVLELAGLTKAFPGHTAVDEIDLDVADGEFVSLLGPSGSGKTTTLRMIAGFEQPTRGQILLGGEDIGGVPAHRRPVNTVFQDYALFPHLSVEQNVAFGLRAKRVQGDEVDRRVREALDLVELGALAGRTPAQLSGGQRQRAALARALVLRPRLLLLDEPLGALDLKLRRQMQLVLIDLCRQLGITFLYVTHDQEEALTMSDRIAVMNEGRIEQYATPEALYGKPASSFVAGFVGDNNLLDGTLVEHADEHCVVRISGSQIEARPSGLQDTQIGEPVILAVRPEAVELTREGGGLGGVVAQSVFVGADARVMVRLDDGQEATVRTSPTRAAGYERGERIGLAFDPGSGWVFPARERS